MYLKCYRAILVKCVHTYTKNYPVPCRNVGLVWDLNGTYVFSCEYHGIKYAWGKTCNLKQNCEHMCLTCEEVLCSQCFVTAAASGQHLNHNVIPVRDGSITTQKQLDDNLPFLSDDYEALKDKHSKMSGFATNISSVQQDMNIMAHDAHVAIEAWKAEQSAELQRCHREAQIKAMTRLEELGRKHKSFQDMLGRLTRVSRISNCKPNEDIAGKVSSLCESFLECEFDIQPVFLKDKHPIQLGSLDYSQVL